MYLEEVVQKVVDVLKHSLQHNVMVFYESRFARQWRPSLLNEGGCIGRGTGEQGLLVTPRGGRGGKGLRGGRGGPYL